MSDAKIILPPCDFSDDEQLLAWLEVVRLTGLKVADEMSENSAYVYAKMRRFCLREGLRGMHANRTARAVALPLARSSESLANVAIDMRVSARRFEALVEAVSRPNVESVDFKIKNPRR